MNSTWKTRSLGDVCEFQRGLTYSKADEVELSKNIVLRANNVDLDSGRVNLSDLRYISEAIKVPASKKIRLNSLLICTASGSRSHLGKVAIIDQEIDAAFGGFMGQITPSKEVDPRFLFRLLTSPSYKRHLGQLTGGTNINNLRFDELAKFQFPLPSIAEQQRIVTVLEQAFAAIAIATTDAERTLTASRNLFETRLTNIFDGRGDGWTSEPMGRRIVFVDYRGKTPPKAVAGVRLITAKNVKMGYLQRHPEEFIEAAAYDGWMTRGLPRSGDVLFTTEAPLGNVAQLDTDEKTVIGQRLITMQPDSNSLDRTFLKYMLISKPLQKAIRAKATGATVQGIKASLLKQVPVFYPTSLNEQGRIVRELDAFSVATRDLERIYARKIACISELRQSLLTRGFSGELTAAWRAALTRTEPAPRSFATPEHVAYIIAVAYAHHVSARREETFGHVKAQKTLHLVESIGGLDLGRQPEKKAAGPNDFAHMLKAEDWAEQHEFFRFVKRPDGGYDFKLLAQYGDLLPRATAALKTIEVAITRVNDLLLPMNKKRAELFATVHAAWNNLILDGAEITDDAIVFEARDNWHPDKLKYGEGEFREIIRFIRERKLVPDGSAKRVTGQSRLL